MAQTFFEKPILNSPYQYPALYWEPQETGQPNDTILPERRKCAYVTPVPKAKKSKAHGQRAALWLCLRKSWGSGQSPVEHRTAFMIFPVVN